MARNSTLSPRLRKTWIAALSAASLLQGEPAAAPPEGPLRILSSGTLDYDFETGAVSGSGPVEAEYGPYRLEAGRVEWRRGEGLVKAEGGIRLSNPGEAPDEAAMGRGGDFFEAWWPGSYRGVPFVLVAGDGELSTEGRRIAVGGGISARFPYGRLNAGRLRVLVPGEGAAADGGVEAEEVRAGTGNFLIEAERVQGDDAAVELSGAALTLGEPSDWGPRIRADRIRRKRGSETISLYGATLGIGPVPVLYLPQAWLRDWDLGVSFDLGGGYSDKLGVYGEFGVGFGVGRSFRLEPAVSWFGKRGLLWSPNFSWKRTSDSGDYYTEGSVLAGVIHDQGGQELRGVDRFGDPIGASRGYALAQGLGNRRGGWSFVNQFEARSDTEVLRDFRPGLESRFFAPESFSELFVPFGPFSFTALGRFRTLDMTESIQALPSLQVGLEPDRLGDSGLLHEGWAGYARLEREDFNGADLASTDRWEAAYRLSRPVDALPWLAVTPLAGVRQRSYQAVEGGGADGSSTLFEAGVELRGSFHRSWETASRIWDVDGLLHQVEPLAGYRWMPRTGMPEGEIPAIHPDVYNSGVDPLGFDNLVYRSDSGALQTLRLGVENRLLAGRYGEPSRMRSLGFVGLYQDFNEARSGAPSRPANTMLSLSAEPAPWLGLRMFTRVETSSATLIEWVPGLRLRDGDRWESRWYFQSLQRRVNQLLWDAEVGLTRRDRFLFEMRYSGQERKVTRHAYGWQRRIGNSWLLETRLIFRQDDTRESDFQINFSATSLLF